MLPPGFVVLGVRRAFRARPGKTLSSRELLAWTYPRGAGKPLRERCNHFRSIRRVASKMCVRVGRRWPHGVLWKLRDPGANMGANTGKNCCGENYCLSSMSSGG
jgi:hypothetical protein